MLEIYGDPHVHPQSEEYWGNVNPVSSCILIVDWTAIMLR
jgi:hypothetical protein